MSQTTLITGGLLLDKAEGLHGVKKDLLLSEGKIAKIADSIPPQPGWRVVTLAGDYLSPGFIDTHVHAYTALGLGVSPDRIGVSTGVTTLLDAGSAGPENMEDFLKRDIRPAQTRVLAAMHFVKTGLLHTPEADSPEKYELDSAVQAAKQYSDTVVAIKARASNSTVGAMGIVPIRAAKELATRANLPLMVHIGNPPPEIEQVLELMEAGDVITHAYHGKVNGLLENGVIKPATQLARERGVRFDVGHGVASFNFNTARAAFAQGFLPNIVSTDLHARNVDGPVYNLPVTMSKMLALGIPLEDCVAMVTGNPAAIYRLDQRGLGALREGFAGDITIFTLQQGRQSYTDADGNSITGDYSIHVNRVFINGGQIDLSEGE